MRLSNGDPPFLLFSKEKVEKVPTFYEIEQWRSTFFAFFERKGGKSPHLLRD